MTTDHPYPLLADVLVLTGGEVAYRTWTYGVPSQLASQVQVGVGVIVPLKTRLELGVVLKVYPSQETPIPPISHWEKGESNSPLPLGEGQGVRANEGQAVRAENFAIRPIEGVLNQPMVEGSLLELVRVLERSLLCSPAEAVQTVLPSVARYEIRTLVELIEPIPALRSRAHQMVVETLRAHGGRMSLKSLKRMLASAILNSALPALRAKGLLRTSYELEPPPPLSLGEEWIEVVQEPVRLESFFSKTAERAPVQTALLTRLLLHPEGRMPMKVLIEETGANLQSLRSLETKGLVRRVLTHPRTPEGFVPPQLTPHQQRAIERLRSALAQGVYAPFLLYGVTGSGKTEVYLRASAEALRLGRTVLFLVPEIALTAQLVSAFRERFGDSVAVWHSQLSPNERYAQWMRIRSQQAPIVVGARSALFAPLQNIGLIVVDEEHEPSYKQSSFPPYHARTLAYARAKSEQAVLLLGSATPSLETFYLAEQGMLERLDMPERVGQTPLPSVEVIDLRGGKFTVLTQQVLEAVRQTTSQGYQAILFLNRRGYAPFLLCRECGHVPYCPNCSVALTYHRAGSYQLRCHYCNHRQPPPTVCPQCGGVQVVPFGVGTQRIEAVLRQILPDLRVARLDRDVMSGRTGALQVLQAFRAGEIDVLIGTQMVARGLDFPRVQVVGVVSADMGLRIPDFRASERTFHLLMQVAGRAGRRDQQGRVLIQTYCPDHPAIVCAQHHDYEGFYRYELELRREPLYPPFCRLVNVLSIHENPLQAQSVLVQLRERLHDADILQVLGPAPAVLERLEGKARYHLLLKFPPDSEPAEILAPLLESLTPRERAQLYVDIDPQSLM